MVQFMEAVDERLVLGATDLMDGDKPIYGIEIYDDYRE